MTEPELRALVRDVIARHTGREGHGFEATPGVDLARLSRQHSSHAMFVLPAGSDSDGPCLIEPAVTCNHCGYCKTYGH
jgi:hypothetical protein